MQSIVLCSSTISANSNITTDFTSKSFEINTFEHPKKVPFICLTTDKNKLYELQSVETSKFTSWFINQRVCSRSEIFLMNKYDLRFLLLPYLEKSGTRYSPMDQIIQSSISSGGSRNGNDQLQHHEYLKSLLPFLQNIHQHYNMAEMCDVNDKFDDMILFRYNEEKVLNWLKAKIHKIETCLAKHRQVTQSSSSGVSKNPLMSSTFNFAAATATAATSTSLAMPPESSSDFSNKDNSSSSSGNPPSAIVQRIDTIQAIQILTDYLTIDMTKKLLLHLNITEDELLQKSSSSSSTGASDDSNNNNKRKVATTDWELELEIEREVGTYKAAAVTTSSHQVPAATNNSSNIASKQNKPSTSASSSVSHSNNSKQQQQQAKAASGTKSIHSFFGGGGGASATKKK